MKKRFILFISTLIAIMSLALLMLSACSPVVSMGNSFETIRSAANSYVNSNKPLYITAQQLYDKVLSGVGLSGFPIEWYDPIAYKGGPIIIDIRSPNDEADDIYPIGHIPGSIYMPWREITSYENLNKIPRDREIVVYSDSGETGAQAAAILNILGYNAVNLKWGIASWTTNKNVAPERYDVDKDTMWGYGAYRLVNQVPVNNDAFTLPEVNNIQSGDKMEVLRTAAENYLGTPKRTLMSAPELFERLHFSELTADMSHTYFSNPNNPADTIYMAPFLLDIREENAYLDGHIEGSLNVFWKNIFKVENLKRLPTDRQILVYDDTGHVSGAISALLNMLGYDAVSLRWGIASWSMSLPGKNIGSDRFVEGKDGMNFPFLTGFKSFVCPT